MYRVESFVDGEWKSSGLLYHKEYAEAIAESKWNRFDIHTRVIDDDTDDIVCEYEV